MHIDLQFKIWPENGCEFIFYDDIPCDTMAWNVLCESPLLPHFSLRLSCFVYVRVMSDDTIITTILSIPNHYTREILWIFAGPPLLLHHSATNDGEFHNPHSLLMPTNDTHIQTSKHFNPFHTTLSTSSLLRCCYRSFHILTECF